MKASQLITSALYLSGIVSRDLETASGSLMTTGLELLQLLLEEKAINGILIPYYNHFELSTIPGQEIYDVDGLIDLREMTFNIGEVRYKMTRDTQKNYFGDNRVDNIASLPYHFFAERRVGGMRLYLYFLPDRIYQLRITGKFEFLPIQFESDLDDQMDAYYISYLRYALAKSFCDQLGYPFSAQKNNKFSELEYKVTEVSGVDLSVNKRRQFSRNSYINYAQANIGKGFTP